MTEWNRGLPTEGEVRELTEAELESIAGGDASSQVKSAFGGVARHIVSGAGAVETVLGPMGLDKIKI